MAARLSRSIVVFALLLSATLASPPSFPANTDLVLCSARVLDQKRRPVLHLERESFQLFDNGVQQPIIVFDHEDSPVSLGLVIDDSAGMSDKRARVAAAAFSLAKDSNPADEMFVVNFNDEAFLDLPAGEDFTSDSGQIQQALKRIRATGDSSMRDAVQESLDHLQTAHQRRKALVIVTNGRTQPASLRKKH